MAEKRGQYQYNDDGSVSSLVAGDIAIEASKAIVPVDIQARLSQTIQTHNAVSVAATTGVSDSIYIDCDGFGKIAVTMLNDAATNSIVDLRWSNDGVNTHGLETLLSTANIIERIAITDIKARYLKVRLKNTDAAAHIMSAWAYLTV